jgi:hypothetical protein
LKEQLICKNKLYLKHDSFEDVVYTITLSKKGGLYTKFASLREHKSPKSSKTRHLESINKENMPNCDSWSCLTHKVLKTN